MEGETEEGRKGGREEGARQEMMDEWKDGGMNGWKDGGWKEGWENREMMDGNSIYSRDLVFRKKHYSFFFYAVINLTNVY